MDLELGWSFTFDFDNFFILISNLQTTDVSFMPRVAVWISLHAWLIHGFGLCVFASHPKKQDKIQPLLQSTLRLSIHFECWEFCHKRKQETSQDRLGKDVCNSLAIRIKLKLAPTSTLRIRTIIWKFASHKTPKCTGLYLPVDSQNGLNYQGRIIACCSMSIVSRTGGVVVCTLSLHAEGPWFKPWQVVHLDLE